MFPGMLQSRPSPHHSQGRSIPASLTAGIADFFRFLLHYWLRLIHIRAGFFRLAGSGTHNRESGSPYPFRIVRVSTPINSPRDAASNLSASTGSFDGMFFRASWSSARSSGYFASTEFTQTSLIQRLRVLMMFSCVRFHCFSLSLFNYVVPDGCGFSSSSCFPSSVTRCGIGAEERPQAISTISGSGLA